MVLPSEHKISAQLPVERRLPLPTRYLQAMKTQVRGTQQVEGAYQTGMDDTGIEICCSTDTHDSRQKSELL